MTENERYGVLRFLFNEEGYDLTQFYALVKLPNIQPRQHLCDPTKRRLNTHKNKQR